jgi:hypothetical protein
MQAASLSVCLMPSVVSDSARSGSWLTSFIIIFRACGPDPSDRRLGVVIQGLLEGLLWSDVDIGVEELSLGPEPTIGATGF